MAEQLTFMMGKYAAVMMPGLRYHRTHFWSRPSDTGSTFGFTSYAIRLMQDVYFLDWQVNAGDKVKLLEQIGHIETSKAVSDLFAPVAGMVKSFNQEVLSDPSLINVDGFGKGWLFEMECDANAGMDVHEYMKFLEDNWEKTQRMLKGKINSGDD